jgi:hypothetical protein
MGMDVVAHDPGRALAGTPWLDVFCPGCGTSRAIDLRTLDRHPLASVGTLVLGLRLVPWRCADAEADRAVRAAASSSGHRQLLVEGAAHPSPSRFPSNSGSRAMFVAIRRASRSTSAARRGLTT